MLKSFEGWQLFIGGKVITENTLGGYVLEELLARELQSSGFQLLQTRADDEHVLRQQGNGLAILGRGGVHQVDVLGELAVKPRFVHPLRLFVEAKHRPGTAAGIEVIRNAVGVIADVREHFTREHAKQQRQRYSYRYAIFSTGGFANSAVDYAITHDISTIDMSAPEWGALGDGATAIARRALEVATAAGRDKFPVNLLRKVLRAVLIDHDESVAAMAALEFARKDVSRQQELLDAIDSLDAELSGTVALVSAGSGLLTAGLLADYSDLQRLSLDQGRLTFESKSKQKGVWALSPASRGSKPMLLALPPRLERDFLTAQLRRRRPGDRYEIDILVNDPDPISVTIEAPPSEEDSAAGWRRTREKFTAEIRGYPWTENTASLFMKELEATSALHARLIELAVSRAGRGRVAAVSRAEIYDVMGYSKERSLRGFSRPVRSVVLRMIDRGWVQAEVEWPLSAWYKSGVRATEFRVPEDFAEALKNSRGV